MDNKIDIVIPFRNSEVWQNNELKYTLRSIEKHLKNYRNIYLIGKCPDFLNSVSNDSEDKKVIENRIIHQRFGDTSYRTDNIKNKILEACRIPELSDNFLYTNDDIFFLKDVDAINYPYYYDANIINTIKGRTQDTYKTSLENTYKVFYRNELPVKHFDIHFPIIYNKQKFVEIITKNNWNLRYGFVIKSLYCNSLKIEGELNIDCKIRKPLTMMELTGLTLHKDVFSIDDEAINDAMMNKLKKLYPNKSKYEK